MLFRVVRKLFKILLSATAGKTTYQSWYALLLETAIKGLNINTVGDLIKSGEQDMLKLLATIKRPIIFDIGANTGAYSRLVRDMLPGSVIHAFEPASGTFAELKKNIKYDNVQLHNFGFSNVVGEMDLHLARNRSGLASVYDRKLDHFGIKLEAVEKIRMRTIDEFCAEQKIGRIDLLKLDIEGHELSVLQGAKRMIDSGSINMIQFEFGGCNIDSRTFFQDFYYLLNDRYQINRILKDGLFPIGKYRESLEIFMNTNYLAIKR